MRKMLYIFLLFFTLMPCRSTTVNWASKACLVNGTGYFTDIMQDTVKEIETEIHWCNMKLDDINQFVNTSYYNLHVRGQVNYTNGFTLSVQALHLINIRTLFSTRTINGTNYGNVYIEGTLRFTDLKVGFDIRADLEDSREHHFTSTHNYKTITMALWINRNLYTNETTSGAGYPSLSAVRDTTTEYFPVSNITEVVARRFTPNSNAGSIERWGKEIIAPLLVKHSAKFKFPEIRFDGC